MGDFNFDNAFKATDQYWQAYKDAMNNGQTDGFSGFSGSLSHDFGNASVWPEPKALPGGLLPVPRLSEVMIPQPFALFTKTV